MTLSFNSIPKRWGQDSGGLELKVDYLKGWFMMCWIKWESTVINEVFQNLLSFIASGLTVFLDVINMEGKAVVMYNMYTHTHAQFHGLKDWVITVLRAWLLLFSPPSHWQPWNLLHWLISPAATIHVSTNIRAAGETVREGCRNHLLMLGCQRRTADGPSAGWWQHCAERDPQRKEHVLFLHNRGGNEILTIDYCMFVSCIHVSCIHSSLVLMMDTSHVGII